MGRRIIARTGIIKTYRVIETNKSSMAWASKANAAGESRHDWVPLAAWKKKKKTAAGEKPAMDGDGKNISGFRRTSKKKKTDMDAGVVTYGVALARGGARQRNNQRQQQRIEDVGRHPEKADKSKTSSRHGGRNQRRRTLAYQSECQAGES